MRPVRCNDPRNLIWIEGFVLKSLASFARNTSVCRERHAGSRNAPVFAPVAVVHGEQAPRNTPPAIGSPTHKANGVPSWAKCVARRALTLV